MQNLQNHRWIDEYTRAIYWICYWNLIHKILDNVYTLNASVQTLHSYAVKSCLVFHDANRITVNICLRGITSARRCTKQEITKIHAKEKFQLNLASDIIHLKYRQRSPSTSISDKLEREDLIETKLANVLESTNRRNLFTMLKFEIKSFVDPRWLFHTIESCSQSLYCPIASPQPLPSHHQINSYWKSNSPEHLAASVTSQHPLHPDCTTLTTCAALPSIMIKLPTQLARYNPN
jgi:hypothetical protein